MGRALCFVVALVVVACGPGSGLLPGGVDGGAVEPRPLVGTGAMVPAADPDHDGRSQLLGAGNSDGEWDWVMEDVIGAGAIEALLEVSGCQATGGTSEFQFFTTGEPEALAVGACGKGDVFEVERRMHVEERPVIRIRVPGTQDGTRVAVRVLGWWLP